MAAGTFHAYIDIFNGDNVTDNAVSKSDSLQSKDLVDSGWCVIKEADPALASIVKPPCEQGTDDSPGECQMRKKGAAKSSKLCGYLNKYKVGARGGRVFKRRWFVHADRSCKLLYYRTPQDAIPLGEIDIAQAIFSFDVQPNFSANVFRIM